MSEQGDQESTQSNTEHLPPTDAVIPEDEKTEESQMPETAQDEDDPEEKTDLDADVHQSTPNGVQDTKPARTEYTTHSIRCLKTAKAEFINLASKHPSQGDLFNIMIEREKNPPNPKVEIREVVKEVQVEKSLGQNQFVIAFTDLQLKYLDTIQKNRIELARKKNNPELIQKIEAEGITGILKGMALQDPRIEDRDNTFYTGIRYITDIR